MNEETKDTQAERAEKETEAKRRSALVRQSTALQPYGTPEELAELVGRMKFMIPGGDKLDNQQIWGLCQASILLGLNPLMQEIFWIDGPSPGIRGLRRKGREQLVEIFEEKGLPALDFVLVTDAQERVSLFIPDGALAYKCLGMVPAKRTAYTDDAKKLSEAGAPWERIEALLGTMPITVGYGYITVEEMRDKDLPEWWHVCQNTDKNTSKIKDKMQHVLRDRVCPDCGRESWKKPSSYSHVQHAQKRAEAHFWKLECDLPFNISPSGEGLADFGAYDENVIDGKVVEFDGERPIFMGHEVPDHIKTPEEFEAWVLLIAQENERQEAEAKMTPEEREADSQEASENLYGDGTSTHPSTKKDPPKPTGTDRPLPPERLKVRFDTLVESKKGSRRTDDLQQKVFLNFKDCFEGAKDTDIDRHAVQLFLTGKPSLPDWTGAELLAALLIMDPQKGKNGWHPNALSVKEIRLVAKHMKEEA